MIPIGRGADPIDPQERAAELEHYATEYRRLEQEGLVTEPRETDTLRRLADRIADWEKAFSLITDGIAEPGVTILNDTSWDGIAAMYRLIKDVAESKP